MLFSGNIYHMPTELLSYKDQCLSKIYLRCAGILAKAGQKNNSEKFFEKSKESSFWDYMLGRYFKIPFVLLI